MAERLRGVSIVDAVYEALRERILTGEIKASEAIYEEATARLYGVARPTVKAAIDRLLMAGLLTRSSNRSACVPELLAGDVSDLYFSRKMFEGSVVEYLSTKGLPCDRAEASLQAFDRALNGDSILGLIDTDISFHRALVECVGSARILRMYDAIVGEAHLCMVMKQTHHLHAARKISEEHKAIYRAIKNRDADRARRVLLRHLENSEKSIVTYIESGEGGVETVGGS